MKPANTQCRVFWLFWLSRTEHFGAPTLVTITSEKRTQSFINSKMVVFGPFTAPQWLHQGIAGIEGRVRHLRDGEGKTICLPPSTLCFEGTTTTLRHKRRQRCHVQVHTFAKHGRLIEQRPGCKEFVGWKIRSHVYQFSGSHSSLQSTTGRQLGLRNTISIICYLSAKSTTGAYIRILCSSAYCVYTLNQLV